MTIAYQCEKFVDIITELPEIFYKHWDEVTDDKENSPLDIAWPEYIRMDSIGILHVVTARAEGRLIGYVFSIVHPQLNHKQILTAYTPLLYMRREYTRGFGVFSYARLIRHSEKMLRDLGVRKRYLTAYVHHDLTPLFERLGYRFKEKISEKLL